MSAAATAAGYLYATGRLSKGARKQALRLADGELVLQQHEQDLIAKGMPPEDARELALERLKQSEKRAA